MTRRVGLERSIMSRARGAKIGCSGEGRGREACRKREPRSAVEAKGSLTHARVGCGGRGVDNSSQSHPFLPPFHRYIDWQTRWLLLFSYLITYNVADLFGRTKIFDMQNHGILFPVRVPPPWLLQAQTLQLVWLL